MPDTAVVTGAGGGLGRAITRRLSEAGFDVLATDVDATAAYAAAQSVPRAWPAQHDVRRPDDHRRIAQEAGERGRLAVWVNNAGVLPVGRAWSHSDEDVAGCIDTNVLGVLYGSRAAVEAMRTEAGGSAHVVNIASFAAFGPVPQLSVYTAAKHAVLGFTTSLQGDLRAERLPIRAHLVCLDGTDTPMVRQYEGDPQADVLWHRGRLLDPDDVARHVVAALNEPRLVTTVPRGRGFVARLLSPAPRLSLRLMELASRPRASRPPR